MSRYKTSYGLALCRYNYQENNRIEILSIKKRFTYYYFIFVHGFYKSRSLRNNDIGYIKYLFDNMSFEEKLIILSRNYGNMWWYIWLNNPEKGIDIFDQSKLLNNKMENGKVPYYVGQNEEKEIIQSVCDYSKYFKKKNKFEKKFLLDGGKRLAEIINNSKNCEAIWEIPKGGKDTKETDLDTAIREFTEETEISSKYYNILYHINPVILTYKDNGVIYRHIYYLAELNKEGYNEYKIMKPKVNFKSCKQLSEVADINWLSLAHINLLNLPNKNKKNMLKLYGDIIRKYKKV
jgi:8-oxo-dGTP pyrophosphatase MutT (NUDIX family)